MDVSTVIYGFRIGERIALADTNIYRLTCAPIQVVRFLIPAVCILTIITYTIVIAVVTEKKKNHNT